MIAQTTGPFLYLLQCNELNAHKPWPLALHTASSSATSITGLVNILGGMYTWNGTVVDTIHTAREVPNTGADSAEVWVKSSD